MRIPSEAIVHTDHSESLLGEMNVAVPYRRQAWSGVVEVRPREGSLLEGDKVFSFTISF